MALADNGTDDKGRVIGSQGKRPILRNVSAEEISAFRQQVQVIDMIGCQSADEIFARVEELRLVPGITDRRVNELAEWLTVAHR